MLKWLLPILVYSLPASAYFQMDFLKNKNSAKASSRWTLADWLSQKSKAQLADQWLALNRSANIFETVMSGGYNDYTVKADGATAKVKRHSQSYQLDTYISIFNLMGEYEKTDDDLESYGGAAGLRLLGNSSQTTNLVARYGWRKLRDLESQEEWENQFAEGALQVYLIQAFGITGKYRHYFPNKSNRGNNFEGYRATAGAFLEFGVFRFFGNYYKEPIKEKSTREGLEYGLKLMF